MKQDRESILHAAPTGNQHDRGQRTRCVDDVMTREVVSLSPRHNFDDAVNLISNHHFRHFVVVDNGQIVGIVSDRDVLRGLARTDNWQEKQVSEFMTIDPTTVKPDTSLSDAITKMLDKKINCLPVIADDGTVCGILTSTDLLKAYQKELESVDFKQR
jgi:predicted transcriptional regulator